MASVHKIILDTLYENEKLKVKRLIYTFYRILFLILHLVLKERVKPCTLVRPGCGLHNVLVDWFA